MSSSLLLLGDCRSMVWPTVDAMITDPPYRSDVHKKAISQSPSGGVRSRDLGFECLTDSLREFVGICAGGVRRWSVIYSDVESVSEWRGALHQGEARYIRSVPWVRWSMPQLSADRPPSGCEMIVLAWGTDRGKKSWNGPGNLTHFDHKCLRGSEKHKAEKPLDQVLDLVEYFSNPGETVFDPFAGSGTIGLACKILGRDFVGSEIDPEWHDRAKARIEQSNHMSARDSERYERWIASKKLRYEANIRIRDNTSKIRQRVDRAKELKNDERT